VLEFRVGQLLAGDCAAALPVVPLRFFVCFNSIRVEMKRVFF
jgi:hypothetical protein